MLDLWEKYEKDTNLQRFYLEHRVEEQVNCITFKQLISKYQIKQVDLLQIDAEGYEYEILNSIDFATTPIRFINYESVLLHKNKRKTDDLLRKNGYVLTDYGLDTFAYKKEDSDLTKCWTRA